MGLIQEIENRTFAELKAERDELVAALRMAEIPDVVAARYVKALMDAKHRDENLGEQGKTITALQTGLKAATAQAEAAALRTKHVEAERDAISQELAALRTLADEQCRGLAEEKSELHTQLRAAHGQVERFRNLAIRTKSAAAQAAHVLNVALAEDAVDVANQE
jgi:hypothetical protein